jgi:hypothetical protein
MEMLAGMPFRAGDWRVEPELNTPTDGIDPPTTLKSSSTPTSTNGHDDIGSDAAIACQLTCR